MNYGSLGKRVLGAFIDGLAVQLISAIIIPFIGFYYFDYGYILFYFGWLWIIYAAYSILMQGGAWHATLGQKAFDLVVVDENGNGADYKLATIRYFSSLISSLALGFGYIMALFSDERQTLHDKIAGTYVVDAAGAYHTSPSAGRAGTASVVGIAGEKAGMSFPIYGNGIMIGRDPAVCQIVMHKSSGVSRLHCLVSYNPSSRMFVITDRGSSYGTYTESGIRITPKKSVALKSGERFYIGSKQIMFEVR